MRRYAVRFLVAVLTFGIGVALSLAFGLFRVQSTRIDVREYRRSRDCPKKFRVARPAFLNVDSQSTDPLGFVYLGTTPDITGGSQVRMRFAVANRSEKTISGYLIKANEIWNTSYPPKGLEWTAFEMLEPGDTSTITIAGNAEGSSLRVFQVTFKDGSTWTNPRMSE